MFENIYPQMEVTGSDKWSNLIQLDQKQSYNTGCKTAPLKGRLHTLRTNIIHDWKGLLGTNALTYYDMELITAVKGFDVEAPDENELKVFFKSLFQRMN